MREFGESGFARQLKQVASVIAANNELGTEREVFYLSDGGFDMHKGVKLPLEKKFSEIDLALSSFAQEMEARGLWESVAVVSASDFGRTLTPNSADGTDHAWGGNHFIVGGSVNGGKVHGAYPAKLGADSEVTLNRGRVVPTTPWEGVWHPLAQWLGVRPSQLASVVPNAHKFIQSGQLLAVEEVFSSV